MSNPLIERLRTQIGGPYDGALLRFSLANALLAQMDRTAAIDELRAALKFDPHYSAAWKLLGRTLVEFGDREAAISALRNGILAAVARGDKQAEKEMTVFLRRAEQT